MRLLPAFLFLTFVGVSYQTEAEGYLKVRVVTWNVAGQTPKQDMDQLLGFTGETFPDVIFMGVQENEHTGLFFTDHWYEGVKSVMGERGFQKVGRICHSQACLYSFVKEEIHNKVDDILMTKIDAYGFKRFTKGGITVRFTINGRSYLFINCHLPAHDGHYNDRIQLANKIWKESIEGDYNFWTGDMNFRLDEDQITPEGVAAHIEAEEYLNFLNKDELKKAMKLGDAFPGFSELPITFKPTFKFHLGTNKYNTKRRPAWTDRVLYKVRENSDGDIEGLTYQRIGYLQTSDHKPVFAEFRVKM